MTRTFISALISCLAVQGLASHGSVHQRGHGGGGNRGASQGHAPAAAPAHARRDVVRTTTFAGRPSGGQQSAPQPPRQASPGFGGPQRGEQDGGPRPPDRSRPNNSRPAGGWHTGVRPTTEVFKQRTFTKTPQGRVYDNGLVLRKGIAVTAAWEKPYFPHGYAHFPYYRPSYVAGSVFISPFGFYFGVCAPFLDRSRCHVFPPTLLFVDVPIYNGANCVGYPAYTDENYFDRTDLDTSEPGLVNAVNELTETFQNGNIDSLISLIDPNVSVAIYLRGKYRYSLASDDFVDLTRDAIRSTTTVQFNLNILHQRSPGVFSVSGTHIYNDRNGVQRTVYVSYVLQDFGGQWTLTQVGTAPDRVQKWQ